MSNGDLGAIFGSAFDAGQHDPLLDYQPIPPGKYQVVIQKAEVKDTKKLDGKYIWLEMVVINHPTCNNRKLYCNINIDNPNAQCVQMGLALLSALARAVNIPQVADSSQLVNQTAIAHVKVKNDQNNVRTFSAVSAVAPGAVAAQPVAKPVAPRPVQQPMQPAAAPMAAPAVAPAPVASAIGPPMVPPTIVQQPAVVGTPRQQPMQQPALPWAGGN